MTTTTTAPSASFTNIVREELLAAIEAERAAIRDWLAGECATPPNFVYWRAVRNLIDVWSTCEHVPDDLIRLVPFVYRLAEQTRNHLLRWGETYAERMPETAAGLGGMLTMGEALGEQVKQLDAAKIELESVAELLEQKVDLAQIARMWGTDVDTIKAEKANPGSVKFVAPLPDGIERSNFTDTIRKLTTTARVVEELFRNPNDRDAAAKHDPESRIFSDIHCIAHRE
jgi:hypothetical protein